MLKHHRILIAITCCCLAISLSLPFFFQATSSAQNTPTTLPGYLCYRTLDTVLADAEELTTDYPELADWIDIGDSWVKQNTLGESGYDLNVLKLTNRSISGSKPILFLLSALHARDLAPVELSLRFAEQLLSDYGTDPEVTWLLDEAEIQILLVANPDGRAVVEDQIDQGMAGEGGGDARQKNLHAGTCPDPDDIGIDLQRNFPLGWQGGNDECLNDYSGDEALSEPEAEALHTYLGEIFPDYRAEDPFDSADLDAKGLLLNLNSYGDTFTYPYAYTSAPAPEEDQLYTLANKLAYGLNADLLRNAPLLRGSPEDDLYAELGIPALTYSIGERNQGYYFMNCSDFNAGLESNLAMLKRAAKAAFAPYILPAGPEIKDLRLRQIRENGEEVWQITAIAESNLFRLPLDTPPAIASAVFSIDRAPWEDDAVTFTLQPADGCWNDPIEELVAIAGTDNLQPGTHRVYVQAFSQGSTPGLASVGVIQVEPEPLPTPTGFPSATPGPTPTPISNIHYQYLPWVER